MQLESFRLGQLSSLANRWLDRENQRGSGLWGGLTAASSVLAAPGCAWAAGTLAWPAGQASERPGNGSSPAFECTHISIALASGAESPVRSSELSGRNCLIERQE